MFQVEMNAEQRSDSGKGAMRRLRSAGKTPAVVYGGGGEAKMLQMETKPLMNKLLQYARKNTVVSLKIDGTDDKNVLIGEIQTDPISDTLVHVDFCEIDLEKERIYKVPVVYKGTAKGVDLGGSMAITCRELVLKGKPLDIPNECVVNVGPLGLGATMTCGEIEIPGSVTLLSKGSVIAVTINRPVAKAVEVVEKPKKKK